MTTQQIAAFSVLAGMMALFIWGRLRYDLVAILALLASVILGTVSAKDAFGGFSDDIVIIVASALVVSAAVERSGMIEAALRRASRHITSVRSELLLLVASVTFLSALVKNIGALAMLMPAAFKMAKRSDASPSVFLMPMAFGSLLGGLITLVGTSPNIIVSRVREEMVGQPFGMFDYTPVGLSLALIGIIFLRFGYRLLPRDRRAVPTMGEALNIEDYITEAAVTPNSPLIGKRASQLFEKAEHPVQVSGWTRDGARQPVGSRKHLKAGDILMLTGEPDALEQAIATQGLALAGQHRTAVTGKPAGEVGVIEAVVTRGSLLDGSSAGAIGLHERIGVNLLAVARAGKRLTARLGDIRLMAGDVLVLQGSLAHLPAQLAEMGCLPLAERSLRLGNVRRGLLPIAILAGAMLLTALGLVPVAIAFFGAATLVILTGALPIRDAYQHIEWPILVMLGALIPVSEALQTSGATQLIATWLSHVAAQLPAWGALTLIMVAAMAVTPFLNNAATVLVMAPIAASFATNLHLRPDAFLMAVAVGAGCDFLTPIGHQCNTLVMGPGGYRFGDYARLGAPLSLIVVIAGVPLILLFWPVT